jgi:hypothetical protein
MINLVVGKNPVRPLLSQALSVAVPSNFAGVQLYKETAFDPACVVKNSRPWGTVVGTQGCNWNDIETSKGVFDWTSFDAAFARCAAVPVLYFTLGRTPAWAGPAINQAPTLTSDYADMCTAMVNRAKDAHGRTGVIWDLWNEIDYSASWSGAAATLGPLAKAGYAAIKAADPTAQVLSPSIVFTTASRVTTLTTALAASDGAAGTLKDWLDGICIHYYAQDKLAQWYDTTMQWAQIVAMKAALAAAGVSALPIHVNESGVDGTGKTYNKADQKTAQLRAMMLCAAAGFAGYCAYVYDTTPSVFGNVSEYIPEWNIFANALNGKTITHLQINGDQSVTLTVGGVTLTI